MAARSSWTSFGIGVGLLAAGALVAVRKSGPSFRGKTVVITGGSRGLGLELARRWASEGARVVICARTEGDLQRAVVELRNRGGDAHWFPCDVTKVREVQDFIDRVIRRFGTIDVLVNNAGIIQAGPCLNMTDEDYREAMDTHFWGPLHMIQAVLPQMRGRREGRIVNISSIGGEISVPHLLPYCASKFALTGLSGGFSAELARDGIHVTTVCPGLMRTGSPRNAMFKGQHRKEYAWFSLSAGAPGITISSSRAAGQIIEACRQGRPYLAVSAPAQVAIRLYKLLPSISVAALRIVNNLLPAPAGGEGMRKHQGKQSFSATSPSPLTVLNERAAVANNEVR